MIYRGDWSRLETSKENAVVQMAAMAFLLSQGVSLIVAAGLVANADSESGGRFRWNPRVKGDGDKALGIFQWHEDRQIALFAFTEATGQEVYSRGAQLSFALQELGLLHSGSTLPGYKQRGWATPHILKATTAYEAGAAISIWFEGPREKERQAHLRGQKAEKIAMYYQNLPSKP